MRLVTSDERNEGSTHWIPGMDGWKLKLNDPISLIPTNQNLFLAIHQTMDPILLLINYAQLTKYIEIYNWWNNIGGTSNENTSNGPIVNSSWPHWIQGMDGWKLKLNDPISLMPTNQNLFLAIHQTMDPILLLINYAQLTKYIEIYNW